MVDIETALKLAVLSNPEAFGLNAADLNPLHILAYRQATGEDEEYEGEDVNTLALDCFAGCEERLEAKVAELMKGVPPAETKRKSRRSSGKNKPPKKGPMISVKQLKYIGFLKHELGEEPDYEAIKKLTQKQASAEIAKLEKRKNKESGE